MAWSFGELQLKERSSIYTLGACDIFYYSFRVSDLVHAIAADALAPGLSEPSAAKAWTKS